MLLFWLSGTSPGLPPPTLPTPALQLEETPCSSLSGRRQRGAQGSGSSLIPPLFSWP